MNSSPAPLIGIGYRPMIHDWLTSNIDRFDVFEVTVEHYIYGGAATRRKIESLYAKRPVIGHGVGLSIGTDVPLDRSFLREVASTLRAIGASSYSEHLAFTKVPGRDLGNLLPLPHTRDVLELIVENVHIVQEEIALPFALENISYLFQWPYADYSEAEFLTEIVERTGAGILLDIENLYVNAFNHGFDPIEFLEHIPRQAVVGVHTAGGCGSDEILFDTHNSPVPEEAVQLLGALLEKCSPETIVLERDTNLLQSDEMLEDISNMRDCLADPASYARSAKQILLPPRAHASPQPAPNTALIDRQYALLSHLTDPIRFNDPAAAGKESSLSGLPVERLQMIGDHSYNKRIDKLRAVFPITLEQLDQLFEKLAGEFAAACPPDDIGRVHNAIQFYNFLVRERENKPAFKPYLLDVAKLELAIAKARATELSESGGGNCAPAIRRNISVQLVECEHDVRALLLNRKSEAAIPERTCHLIAFVDASGEARILELSDTLFRHIDGLSDWVTLSDLASGDELLPEFVLSELVEYGVLEVQL